MQDICCKLSRVAVVVMLLMACAGSAWGQSGYAGGVPWQTGDIVACFGTVSGFGGACNVLRIVSGNAVLLDQFTDNLGGNTYGVAMNNSLHLVATDDAGAGTSKSKVVVYSVASLNPNTSPATTLAHSPVYTYDSSGGNGSARAVAFDNGGNIYVLNNTGTNPSIVELGPGPLQSQVATFSLSNCGINQATSMDLSADASSAYVTSAGTIQKVTLTPGTPPCTKFADFGSNVTLYGIKDIPQGALNGVTPNCNGTACPADEALLVVAIGDTDPDTGETGDTGNDAVNVCTNAVDGTPVSCALLLDTSASDAGLTAPLWQANRKYPGTPTVNSILDPSLHLQNVFTAGTSGNEEPNFSESGGTIIDNAVKWTDLNPQPTWQMNHGYAVGTPPAPGTAAVAGTFFVDPNGNLQTVSTTGTSGQVEPSSPFNVTANPVSWSTTSGGATIDGLQWQFSGTQCTEGCSAGWAPGTSYPVPSSITDNSHFVWNAFTGGTSGASANRPLFESNEIANKILPDNAVVWTESDPSRAASTGYVLNAIVLNTPGTPGAHVEQVTLAGTTGPGAITFSTSGGTVIDGLQWTNSLTASSVVARYPVSNTTTLTSLALDPLIVDCTAGCNSYPTPPLPPPLQITSVITSPGSTHTTSLTSPGFWMGDKQFPNVWKLDFATGTPTEFSANGPEGTLCSAGLPCAPVAVGGIQGIGIYASEGANQPGLARLLFSTDNAAANNQTGFFPSSGADPTFVKNSLELTLLNGSSPAAALGPFAMYASPVAPLSCFDDSPGNPPCLGTFQPGGTGTNFPIMWKNDIPLPSSGNLVLNSPFTLTGNFDFPTSFQSTSNDVTLDSQLDVTTLVGLDSPIYKSTSTSHGRKKTGKNGTPEQDFKCAFVSPVISPSKQCFAGTGTFTIPIKLSCSGLTANQMSKYGVTSSTPWGPNFQVLWFPNVTLPIPPNFTPPPPNPPCDGTMSTGSVPSYANSGNSPLLAPGGCTGTQLPSSNGAITATCKNSACTYNWAVQATSQGAVYQIWAFDDSDGTWFSTTTPKEGVPVPSGFFYVKNSCP
jgi:hypothetical protein